MPRTIASNRTTATNKVQVQNIPCSLNFHGGYGNNSNIGTLPTSGITFGGWFKIPTNNYQTYPHLMSIGGNDSCCFYYATALGYIQLKVNNIGGSTYTVNNSSITGNWVHLVGVYDGVHLIFYQNGVSIGSTAATGSITYTDSSLFIMNSGTGSSSGNNQAYGSASNLFILSSALTPQQVLTTYKTSTPPIASLVDYPFTEGSQTTGYDISGNAKNLTLSGTVAYTSDVPSRTRQLVGGNLVYNGNFEFAPPTNTLLTSNNQWLNGSSGGTPTTTSNPYDNGQTGLFGWFTFYSSTGCQFTTVNPHSGNYCIELIATSGVGTGIEGICQSSQFFGNQTNGAIKVSPSTSYTVSFWVNITSVTGTGMPGFSLVYYESTGNGSAGSPSTTKLTAITGGWISQTRIFTTSATCQYLSLVLINDCSSGTGSPAMTVYVDDIVLTPTTNTVRSSAT